MSNPNFQSGDRVIERRNNRRGKVTAATVHSGQWAGTCLVHIDGEPWSERIHCDQLEFEDAGTEAARVKSKFEVGDRVRVPDQLAAVGDVVGFEGSDAEGYDESRPLVDFGEPGGAPRAMDASALERVPASLNEVRDVFQQFGATATEAAQRLSALGSILDQLKPAYEKEPGLCAAVVDQARAIARQTGEAQAMLDRTLAGFDS